MSDSPEARAHSDNDNVDEIADNSGEPESAPQADPSPPKRKRGRPPGSKNKKTLAAEAALAATGSSTESPRRPRGRPPKVVCPVAVRTLCHPLTSYFYASLPLPEEARGREEDTRRRGVLRASPQTQERPPAQKSPPGAVCRRGARDQRRGGDSCEEEAGPASQDCQLNGRRRRICPYLPSPTPSFPIYTASARPIPSLYCIFIPYSHDAA
ncbi:hypothetical protein C2E23DRAFT_806227 [Lenzites betulinus]|nr:hypothetical protein C2E23DRAFT_806227 [Lenzites betulinus]